MRAVLPQLRPPAASTAMLWWTTTRPTAPARSPTGSPPSCDEVEVLHRAGQAAGSGRAYLAGFERALAGGADLVLEMDADFSHDPADLPRLIAAGRRVPTWCSARATCPAAA